MRGSAPRDRVEHLQLGAVQVRHHRHAGKGQRGGVMHRRQVMQVQQSCAAPSPRTGRIGLPTPPPSAHPAPETPTGRRDRAPHRPRLKRRMHRKRRIHRILAPHPPRHRIVVPRHDDVHTGKHRRGVPQRPDLTQRSTHQRDRPPQGLKRARQIPSHPRRAATRIEEQAHPHRVPVARQDTRISGNSRNWFLSGGHRAGHDPRAEPAKSILSTRSSSSSTSSNTRSARETTDGRAARDRRCQQGPAGRGFAFA